MAEKEILSKVSVEVFKDFLYQALSGIIDSKLHDHAEGPEATSTLNLALGKVLLLGHQTNILWCVHHVILHNT